MFFKVNSKFFLLVFMVISFSACSGPNARSKKINNLPGENILVLEDGLAMCKDEALKEDHIIIEGNRPNFTNIFLEKNQYLIDDSKSLEVSISSRGYTRISIDDERITDVFVFPREAMKLNLNDQGYMIVVPDKSFFDKGSNEKIYLTITGEYGTTQDFSLRFIGGNPAPIKFIKGSVE